MGKRTQERRRAKKKQRDTRQRARAEQERAFDAASGFGGCGDPFLRGGRRAAGAHHLSAVS
ncbi:hypothetical protein ACWD0A_17330 [Streptomyces sp. NPDC002867]